jgi:glyoxylase-like metal-dependent hydrolase (beta-lactamase superfamily II)
MNVERFIVGTLQTNCYMITCERTDESVLVDPGGISQQLMDKINEHSVKMVLLTHGHFDHIAGVRDIIEHTDAQLLIHSKDALMLSNPLLNGSFMIGAEITTPEPSCFLTEQGSITFGESSLKILHTPGHTPGGVSFVADGEFVIAGDTLFKLSVGRWDLHGGNYQTLLNTIRDKFSIMPDNTIVYPGHGDITSIGFEKKYNQFMQNF